MFDLNLAQMASTATKTCFAEMLCWNACIGNTLRRRWSTKMRKSEWDAFQNISASCSLNICPEWDAFQQMVSWKLTLRRLVDWRLWWWTSFGNSSFLKQIRGASFWVLYFHLMAFTFSVNLWDYRLINGVIRWWMALSADEWHYRLMNGIIG